MWEQHLAHEKYEQTQIHVRKSTATNNNRGSDEVEIQLSFLSHSFLITC